MTLRNSDISLMPARTVGVCDTQPIAAEGLKALADASSGLRFLWAVPSLRECLESVRESRPDILILDKGFGMQAVMEMLQRLGDSAGPGNTPATIVWGSSMTEAESLRLLQSGARGVFPKTAPVRALEECFAAILSGGSWIEQSVLTARPTAQHLHHSALTQREQQVKDLVEQGLKNSDIARELGIRPGTVKIHLKHIFEKTGVRGRHSLALAGFSGRFDALASVHPQ